MGSVDKVRVVSWNIKGARERGLAAVVETLRALDPDVVLLQEVDSETNRSGKVDQPEVLARALGAEFDFVFAPTLELEGGTYGISAISRLPFQSAKTITLSNQNNREPRTAIEAQLCTGRFALNVVTHHADTEKTGAAQSCEEIADHLSASESGLTLVGGDLNQLPSERGPMALLQAGLQDVLATRDPSATFGSARIDYLYADPRSASYVSEARVVQTDASDHELLWMELRAP